jgi:RNA polymerase sigma factor (sigma-70 family)
MEVSALRRSLPLPRSRRLLAAFSDERLVNEAKRGSEVAFEVIYDRYHRQLLTFCRHMLGSREDAEDALQHTFSRAFRALPRNEHPAQLKSWLYTIARNRALDVLRERKHEPVREFDHPSFEGLSDEVERRAELQELVSDLKQLPERQRAALVLAEVSGLSHAQVADVLECETKQVKSLVFQARAGLLQTREARAISCHEIREEIANTGGRDLRRSLVRRHVKGCSGCAEFEREVRSQRAMLALALPAVPSLGLKEAALAAGGIGGGGAAGGGGLIAALGASSAAKVATVAIVGGGAVGGVAASEPEVVDHARVAFERGATFVGQAASGELDREYAEQQVAKSRRAERRAERAGAKEKSSQGDRGEKAGPGDRGGQGSGRASGRSGGPGKAKAYGGSQSRGRGQGLGHTPKGSRGSSGRGGKPSKGRRMSSSGQRRTAPVRLPSGGSARRELSPRRVLKPTARVKKRAGGALSKQAGR